VRVSEATGADTEHMGTERGHRTLVITRKGGKVVTIPLAPRTARAIDLAIGERTEGPMFASGDGERLDRHAPRRGLAKSDCSPGRYRMPRRLYETQAPVRLDAVALPALACQGRRSACVKDHSGIRIKIVAQVERGGDTADLGQ
jgi:integrase